MSEQRRERLIHDYQLLQVLSQESSIFDMTVLGDPPDRYAWIFHGRGVQRTTSSSNRVELIDEHRIDVRMPFSYPDRPPDVRWQTPIFHPNVSFSGFVHFQDLGLPWNSQVSIDMIVERLWDVARMAFINMNKATNYAARNWLREQQQFSFPSDERLLRDKVHSRRENINVVRYERRRERMRPVEDVFYIGEDTPVPSLPRRTPLPRERQFGADGILFIGDDENDV